MSAPAWINIQTSSGSGNGSSVISVTGSQPHTGRVAQQAVVTGTTNGSATDTCVVTRTAKAEFVTIPLTQSMAAAATSVTVTGTSNSSKLTFSLQGAPSGFSLSSTVTITPAGGSPFTVTLDANNSAVITGDPGANAEYTFAVTINGAAYSGLSSRSFTLTAYCNDNTRTSSCTITQAAGASTISLSPSTITLNQNGQGSATLTITSNDGWTLTANET